MKQIITNNSAAWLRLAFAIAALAVAARMAKPGSLKLSAGPKPGVQEW